MDATGLTLAVITLVFLCWLLAPSARRGAETEPASRTEDSSLATGSSPG